MTIMKGSLIILLLLATTADGQIDSCGLFCNNRGTCQFGTTPSDVSVPTYQDGTDYEVYANNTIDGMYCDCDDGWTGVTCAVSVSFCEDTTEPCFNGGSCVEGVLQSTMGTVHVCDCRKAITEGIKYVGLHCEQASKSIDNSGRQDPCSSDGQDFCLNGGRCLSQSNGTAICDCPNAWTGFHCEIEAASGQNCDLDCKNGGLCTLGYRDATPEELQVDEAFNPNDVANYQHCRCQTGWAGKLCNEPFDKCGDSTTCLQGGDCVKRPNTVNDYACDCSSAANETNSFAGEFCESASTGFCQSTEDANGQQFCNNGGTCFADENGGILSCNCTTGFYGPHCEYSQEKPPGDAALEKCDTLCKHGGKCREGGKDHGILNNFKGLDAITNLSFNINIEHCVCPKGWAGVECDTKLEVCGRGKHVCLHGSRCVSAGEDFQCDCSNSDNSLLAGKYCQHKATVQCNDQAVGFCVNGGACAGYSCTCPDGFRGSQCEIEIQSKTAKATDTAKVLPSDYLFKANAKVIAGSGIAAGLACLIIIITVIITARNQPQSRRTPSSQAAPPTSAFPPSPGTATNGDNDAKDAAGREIL